MKFAFDLRQRVIMPDSGGLTQGVIVSLTASVGAETVYLCSALMSDGRAATVPYGERQLLDAQPTPEVAIPAVGSGKVTTFRGRARR